MNIKKDDSEQFLSMHRLTIHFPCGRVTRLYCIVISYRIKNYMSTEIHEANIVKLTSSLKPFSKFKKK